MLMQKIDSGLTIEHVLSDGGVSEEQRQAADYLRNRMRPGDEELIASQYDKITNTVRHALEANGLDPSRYMPDWHQGNIVVEPTDVPVGGSRYKYWVIDQ